MHFVDGGNLVVNLSWCCICSSDLIVCVHACVRACVCVCVCVCVGPTTFGWQPKPLINH